MVIFNVVCMLVKDWQFIGVLFFNSCCIFDSCFKLAIFFVVGEVGLSDFVLYCSC